MHCLTINTQPVAIEQERKNPLKGPNLQLPNQDTRLIHPYQINVWAGRNITTNLGLRKRHVLTILKSKTSFNFRLKIKSISDNLWPEIMYSHCRWCPYCLTPALSVYTSPHLGRTLLVPPGGLVPLSGQLPPSGTSPPLHLGLRGTVPMSSC